MKPVASYLRVAEDRALRRLTLTGEVLDLGGDSRSAYQRVFRGSFRITTLNLDQRALPHIVHDLERPLPIPDETYDHVLLINVLEHIYDDRQLVSEASRVLRAHGTMIIVVPFLYPVHMSATTHDYRRFTPDALRRNCMHAGLDVLYVEALGTGAFSAAASLMARALPAPLARCISAAGPIVALFDRLHARIAVTNRPEHYALGYLVVARKGPLARPLHPPDRA